MTSKGSTPDTPTSVAGWGLTFTAWGGSNDEVIFSSGATSKKMNVYRARGSATSGNLTVDYSGATQLACDFIMIPVTGGFDTSGSNGSGAAGQSQKGTGSGSTTISVTMTSGNAAAASFGSDATLAGGINPDGSWTEVIDQTST